MTILGGLIRPELCHAWDSKLRGLFVFTGCRQPERGTLGLSGSEYRTPCHEQDLLSSAARLDVQLDTALWPSGELATQFASAFRADL